MTLAGLDLPVHVPHFAAMTDEDLDALVAYLRTLRPAHKQVPARELTGR